MPPSQSTGLVGSVLKLVGVDWELPHSSTLYHHQKTLNVNLPYGAGNGAPNLLIDGTGIKTEGQWNARKQGGSKRLTWRKIHIGIDKEPPEVRAVEVTTINISDTPMLPERLNQIPPDQDIGSVTADGAYDMRRYHDVVAERNANAFIPPRKNAMPWKPSSNGAIARNQAVTAS